MTREPIYLALFAKLETIPGIVTKSRRLKHWSDVPSEQQPAIFQAQRNEKAIQKAGLPTKWDIGVDVYVYVKESDKDKTPATKLNEIIDAIETALTVDVNGYQTLGGLVHHCWIDGTIETDEGTLGEQAAAIIPIGILVSP